LSHKLDVGNGVRLRAMTSYALDDDDNDVRQLTARRQPQQ